MNVFEIFVIFAVVTNAVYCDPFIPFPYQFQYGDYAEKTIANLFNRNPAQARNESQPTTSTTTATPPTQTTETIFFIPVIQETIYQPDYSYNPQPYPVFHSALMDESPFDPPPQFINGIPYAPNLFQPPLPFDRIRPIAENIIVQPHPASPSFIPFDDSKIDITDADRDLLADQLSKFIADFYAKKLHRKEPSTTETNIYVDSNGYESKIIKPSSTLNKPETLNKTVDSFEYNVSDKFKIQSNKTMQNTSTTENDMDGFGRSDFNITEIPPTGEDQITDAPMNVFTTDMYRVEDNRTDNQENQFTQKPKIRQFIDNKGNNCTEELLKHEDSELVLITCEERSFDSESHAKKTTTNVTYFTEELTTETIPDKSTFGGNRETENNKNNSSTFVSDYKTTVFKND